MRAAVYNVTCKNKYFKAKKRYARCLKIKKLFKMIALAFATKRL